MTKKHFESIAAIVRQYAQSGGGDWGSGERCAALGIALQMADYFATDNPRFDRARFLAACGVQS